MRNSAIVPIEVKKGPSGRLRSLHLFLDERPDVPMGWVVNSGNVGSDDKGRIRFLPLYVDLCS